MIEYSTATEWVDQQYDSVADSFSFSFSQNLEKHWDEAVVCPLVTLFMALRNMAVKTESQKVSHSLPVIPVGLAFRHLSWDQLNELATWLQVVVTATLYMQYFGSWWCICTILHPLCCGIDIAPIHFSAWWCLYFSLLELSFNLYFYLI